MGSVNFHANPDTGLVNGNPENQWVLIEIEGERAGQNPPSTFCIMQRDKDCENIQGEGVVEASARKGGRAASGRRSRVSKATHGHFYIGISLLLVF